MKNLFQADAVNELVSRIDKLQPTTEHQWGEMDVAQMMAHCSATLEVASGRLVLPRPLIGRILGPFVRPPLLTTSRSLKTVPTDKKFVIADKRDFAREQEQVKDRIRNFHQGGEARCTKHPHSFFGPLTPQEWATGMHKHIDHHLRQFGV